MIKKAVFGFLCVLVGAIFLISGYAKLDPVEPFEYTLVDLGFINWQVAPFIARLMIAGEFLVGGLLILNLNLKKITYKLAIGMLLFFSIYLLLLMLLVGNKGNCGCFGDYFKMTPLQALVKNAVMIALLFVLNKYHEGWELKKEHSYTLTLIAATALAMPFVMNRVELDYSEAYLNKPEENFKIELDSLYDHATLNIPPRELSKGKHIIAFMSLTCTHCRIAANKIRIIHERNPDISFYFVLNGDEEKLKPFFEDTHTQDIGHCILGKDYFIPMAGLNLPVIYFVNNGFVEYNVNYFDLDQGEIEKWLKK